MNWRDVVKILDKRLARYVMESGAEQNNKYATGYVLANGRQLAVETKSEGSQTNIWIEDVGPPQVPCRVELYPKNKTRISSLSSVAPRLSGPGYRKPPRDAYKVVVASDIELEALLSWYSSAQMGTSVTEIPPEELVIKRKADKSMAENLILFGPPGTGKTYSTTSKAVELCDGKLPDGDAKALTRRFNELRQEGRVSFVTFHQSYGYEEFVEGLRPVAKDGQVFYEVLPGAFKRACNAARLRGRINPGISGKPLRDRIFYKMSLGATWNQEGTTVFDYCIENDCVLLGWGGDIDFSDSTDRVNILERIKSESPSLEKHNSHASFVERFKHDMKVGDLVMVSMGNKFFRAVAEITGEYEYVEDAPFHQMRKVRWLAIFEGGLPASELYQKEVVMSSLYKMDPNSINFEKLEARLTEQAKEDPLRPHVLIIDEINRANISKVFGELITLIEPDKREGKVHQVTVKLPYSGEDFSVPANLYLLGTMNTADRSIALLDTALRRRFEFEEVMPNPELLGVIGEDKQNSEEGINLKLLLAALNERIETLYDRDHMIGHSYFMGVKDLGQLERVFRLKVIPLLQEYFYENWSQVRRVLYDLGEGDFICRKQKPSVPQDGGQPDLFEEHAYIYSVNSTPFPLAAYKRIYGASN